MIGKTFLESLLFAILIAVYRMTSQHVSGEIAMVSGVTIFTVSFVVLYFYNRKHRR